MMINTGKRRLEKMYNGQNCNSNIESGSLIEHVECSPKVARLTPAKSMTTSISHNTVSVDDTGSACSHRNDNVGINEDGLDSEFSKPIISENKDRGNISNILKNKEVDGGSITNGSAGSSAGSVPYRVLLNRSCVGCIVGRGGVTVREIQSTTGAAVRFQRDTEADTLLCPEKVVTISGSPDQKNRAFVMILERIFPLLKAQCMSTTTAGSTTTGISSIATSHWKETIMAVVPQKSVSMIIGSKGQRIQELAKSSGCEIQIQKEFSSPSIPDRTVYIRSTEMQKLAAGIACLFELLSKLVDIGKLSEGDFTTSNTFPGPLNVPHLGFGVPLGFTSISNAHHLIVGHGPSGSGSEVGAGLGSTALCGGIVGGIHTGTPVGVRTAIVPGSVPGSTCSNTAGCAGGSIGTPPNLGIVATTVGSVGYQQNVMGDLGTLGSIVLGGTNGNNILLHPLGNQITRLSTKLVVGAESAAWIVGKSGAHIRDIKQQSGAEFTITECSANYPFTEKDRILSIKGSISNKFNVLKLIILPMEQKTWNADKPLKFLIPAKAASYIIGHKGIVVKQIMRLSNATIQVENQDAPDGERLVYIKGSPESKLCAAIALLQKLEEYDNPDVLKEGLSIPLHELRCPIGNGNMIQDSPVSGVGLFHIPMGYPPSKHHVSATNTRIIDESSAENFFVGHAQKLTNLRIVTTPQQFIIELILPRYQLDHLLHLVKLGTSPFSEISQRSGCQVRLSVENNNLSRPITLSGTPMANAIALLLLQEKVMDARMPK